MDLTREDYVDRNRKALKRIQKRLLTLIDTIKTSEGKDTASHDKMLQDAKDLVILARRRLHELDTGADEAFATDREAFDRAQRELEAAVATVERNHAAAAAVLRRRYH